MTTDRQINDRQLKSVLVAIAEHHSGGFTEALAIANAAIEASDAKYVPMLVAALKRYATLDELMMTIAIDQKGCVAMKTLASLPPELRGE